MNPLWFFVGLEVGDRIRENRAEIVRAGKTVAREAYCKVEAEVEKWRGGRAYHRWLDSHPVKGGE